MRWGPLYIQPLLPYNRTQWGHLYNGGAPRYKEAVRTPMRWEPLYITGGEVTLYNGGPYKTGRMRAAIKRGPLHSRE